MVHNCHPRNVTQRRPQRGVVLIVVTIVVLMMSLAGLSFMNMMSLEHKAVYLDGDQMQLAAVIGSGEELLCAVLQESTTSEEGTGGLLDNPDLFQGVLVLDDPLDGRKARFSVVSPRIENGEITGMRFGAANESARLNLAVLPEWEKKSSGAGRAALMKLPGMTDSVADAILDWIDSDTSKRQFGAEAEYYAGQRVPYAPRNGVPVSLEELLLVRGVTRKLVFGSDVNFNYQLDLDEQQATRTRLGGSQPGAGLAWSSLLTVYSAERNLNPRGEPRIDLNDNDLRQLHQRLGQVFDQQWAEFIILYRQHGPAEANAGNASPSARASAPQRSRPRRRGSRGRAPRSAGGASRPAPQGPGPVSLRRGRSGGRSSVTLDLSQPSKVKIASILDLVDARVQVPQPSDQEPITVESPWTSDRLSLQESLPKLLDEATTTPEPVIRGRINVDLATRPVLQGIPGLDATLVERIATVRRPSAGGSDASRRHSTWLLSEGLVDLSQMKALMPYLTTGGNVFRAQIAAYFDQQAAAARAEVVIDATGKSPRKVYWKDLRLLGLGYPPEALGASPQG